MDKSKVTFRDDNDPLIGGIDRILYIPDANIGVFYDHPDYYLGFSVIQLFESFIKFGSIQSDNYSTFYVNRHYFLTAGWKRPFANDDFMFEPSLLMKTTEEFLPQFDANFKISYNNSYWGGLSIRSNQSIIAMLGFRKKRLHFGYAFDYSMDPLSRKHSYGSHELVLTLKTGDPTRRYRWKRRY